jgi:hypothetical protein
VHNFYQTTVNASLNLPAVKQFLTDYRTLERMGTLTTAERWNELNQSYNSAQAAVTAWIAEQRSLATARLNALPAELTQTIAGYGAPAEQVTQDAADVALLYDPVRKLLEKASPSLNDVYQLLSASGEAEFKREDAMREIKARYIVPPPETAYVMQWSNLPRGTVHDFAELDAWLAELRSRLQELLDAGKTIQID